MVFGPFNTSNGMEILIDKGLQFRLELFCDFSCFTPIDKCGLDITLEDLALSISRYANTILALLI